MKRWTNGLPGATKRLGAMMARRGLSASQPGCARIPMMARSTTLHLRGLMHCCSYHVRRSWISVLLRTRHFAHGTNPEERIIAQMVCLLE